MEIVAHGRKNEMTQVEQKMDAIRRSSTARRAAGVSRPVGAKLMESPRHRGPHGLGSPGWMLSVILAISSLAFDAQAGRAADAPAGNGAKPNIVLILADDK